MISINILIWASQVALDFAGGSDSKASAYQMKTQVQSLGREDLLEKEMATHSSILAWKIPWMEEPGRQVHGGCKESDMTEWLHFHFSGGSVVKNLPTKKET